MLSNLYFLNPQHNRASMDTPPKRQPPQRRESGEPTRDLAEAVELRPPDNDAANGEAKEFDTTNVDAEFARIREKLSREMAKDPKLKDVRSAQDLYALANEVGTRVGIDMNAYMSLVVKVITEDFGWKLKELDKEAPTIAMTIDQESLAKEKFLGPYKDKLNTLRDELNAVLISVKGIDRQKAIALQWQRTMIKQAISYIEHDQIPDGFNSTTYMEACLKEPAPESLPKHIWETIDAHARVRDDGTGLVNARTILDRELINAAQERTKAYMQAQQAAEQPQTPPKLLDRIKGLFKR